MKTSTRRLTIAVILASATFVGFAIAAEEPAVTLEPFEPSYKAGDKFSHPKEVVAPRFLWPFEMRRSAISGEAVILVELDGHGQAKRLATLYSTHPLFARSAIQALKKARWDSSSTDWFYYKVVFDITKEEPNQASEPMAPSGRSSP
jgi:hypothetical protein